jgi:hypothetical protein
MQAGRPAAGPTVRSTPTGGPRPLRMTMQARHQSRSGCDRSAARGAMAPAAASLLPAREEGGVW